MAPWSSNKTVYWGSTDALIRKAAAAVAVLWTRHTQNQPEEVQKAQQITCIGAHHLSLLHQCFFLNSHLWPHWGGLLMINWWRKKGNWAYLSGGLAFFHLGAAGLLEHEKLSEDTSSGQYPVGLGCCPLGLCWTNGWSIVAGSPICRFYGCTTHL